MSGLIISIRRQWEDELDLLRKPGPNDIQVLALEGGNQRLGGPHVGGHGINRRSAHTLPTCWEPVPPEN